MNPVELKVARVRRNISGKTAAEALGLTIDGYYKKEHGDARVTLRDAFTLTKLFDLSLWEFVTIFFDGELPFLQEAYENYRFGETAFPLREARIRAGKTTTEAAEALGMKENLYIQREKGRVGLTLEQCGILSRLYRLSLYEFNDIFFRLQLPFRNNETVPYNNIIPQKAGEINA